MKATLPTLRWPLRIIPTVIVAGRFPLDRTGFDYGYRGTYHALHLHGYRGVIRMDGHSFGLGPDVVTLSVAGGRTFYDLTAPGHHWCIHFQPVPVRGTTMQLPWRIAIGPHREFFTDRMRHIARLHEQAKRNDPQAPLAAVAASIALQELLIWLGLFAVQAAHPPRRRASEEAVDHLLSILNERFAESLTVPVLAGEVKMTQDYMAKCFRRRMGMTIPRYLLRRRIEHARQLLTTTDLPIGRIAARVGMPDPQHFNKQFRLLLGISPSGVRADSAV
jgi:AraC-like DNA-binding protein